MQEARFYEKLDEKKVHCHLCPQSCAINDGSTGFCLARKNEKGTLYTMNYGEVTSIALDPIEKKPLYHFYPGSKILSIGSFGCNLKCAFCQNYSISQYKAQSRFFTPYEMAQICLSQEASIGLAFTYNEPSIWYEYVYDTAAALKELDESKKIVLVTNGFIQKEPLEGIIPYVDAMNIDLKAFSNDFYKSSCKGLLSPVLETIQNTYEKCHIEITTLVINDMNDSYEEIEDIAKFICEIDKDIPLHLSRYFPMYKMNKSQTDVGVLMRCRDIAKKYLNNVYLGNI